MITKGIKSEAKVSVNYAQPSFFMGYSKEIGEEYDYIYYKTIDFDLIENIVFSCYITGDFVNTGKIIYYHGATTIAEETGLLPSVIHHKILDVSAYSDEAVFEIDIGSGTATKVIQLQNWGWYGYDIDVV